MNNLFDLVGRILLGQLFLLAGINKISDYGGTAAYMDSVGISSMLLPLVITLEIAGGLALVLGIKVKWAASALAIFSVLAAILFHANFSDQMQTILFMKNITIAGGLLLLVTHGAGKFSLDQKLSTT